MDGQCEIKPTFKKHKCPCITCLVKGICVNTCEGWELYYKIIMYHIYTTEKQHEPSAALAGHLDNKYQRQRMMRLIKGAVTENACANLKF